MCVVLNLLEDMELSAALLHEHLDRLVVSVTISTVQWGPAVLMLQWISPSRHTHSVTHNEKRGLVGMIKTWLGV